MGYKAEGKIEKIFDAEQKSATFTTREFVIQVEDGQYSQMVKFQLVQDKCNLVDDYNEGDQVEVDFDLRGREWQGKYFTNLQAWRIARPGEEGGESSGSSAGASQQSSGSSAPTNAPSSAAVADFDDDIPF